MVNHTDRTLTEAIFSGDMDYISSLSYKQLMKRMKSGYNSLGLAMLKQQWDIVEVIQNKGVTDPIYPDE
jgi:hypothetical protein